MTLPLYIYIYIYRFSAANLALAGFLLTNALGESVPSRHLNIFNLRLCNAATIRYSQLKFGHMHLCGMDDEYFSPHCCKCNSFGCTAAIKCGNACLGPHSYSLYSGSEHSQFNSPRLVKREAGFPNPGRALIGSNQLWRVNDSPYYQEYICIYIYTSYNRTHIRNAHTYIYINTELLDGNQGHQEETHRPTHRFRRLFLDLLSMGWRGCASAMGAIKLPPSCSSPKIMCHSIHII